MANEIQLAIIKKGVQTWNDWRADNASEHIDLNDADLSNLDLSGCNLAGAWILKANLSGTGLNYANLSNAHLDGADLKKASLQNADLKKSHLREAVLLQASLINADLSEAVLNYADIRKADLSGANLRNVEIADAHLGAAQINKAQFINACLVRSNFVQCDGEEVNFTGANLDEALLIGAVLNRSDFTDAILTSVSFSGSHLYGASFKNADLYKSDFSNAHLSGANLTLANMGEANLKQAYMNGADLTGTNLQNAVLVQTNFENAILTNARIYGISAWDVKGKPRDQSNLVITQQKNYLLFNKNQDSKNENTGAITVDDLQVAQFVHLLLNRQNLRNVIDTITSKAVLILGRFTLERKKILDAMADELRKNNLLPIIFDFERPTNRDFTETIKTLAGISLFIIADITSPKSSPLELQAVVPDYQIPLVPIIQADEQPFSMLSDLIGKHDWVLPEVFKYASVEELTSVFKVAVIDRAWRKHQELQKKKSAAIETLSIEDFIRKPVT